MTVMGAPEDCTPWLECKKCDVTENATVNGIFKSLNVEELEWEGELVPLVDHSKIYLSSPDVTTICMLVPRGVQTRNQHPT